jgi:hypothetical protein
VINAPQDIGTGAANSTDRNGNYVSVDSNGNFTDTLGTIALTVAYPVPPASTTFTYTAPSGAAAHYTMNYTNYTVATNFGFSGTSEYKSSAVVPLVTSIILPDNSQYTIQYEATPSTPSSGACTPYAGTTCVTARISLITLPTGGSITYYYAGPNNGVFADGSTSGLKRVLSDGANWSATWLYTRLTSGTASATTVTAPQLPYDSAQNQSILQFQGIYETQSDVYQGSGPIISSLPISESTLRTSHLLQETQTCYNGSASPCPSTAITLPISSQAVITILPGSPDLESKVATSYNSYGQLTEEDDYDFGKGAPSSTAARKEIITIQTVGTYHAIQTAQTQDGSGHVWAQTQMTFDEGTPGDLWYATASES